MRNFLYNATDILGELRSPVCISPDTIIRHAMSTATLEKVICVCDRLSSDPFTECMIDAYRIGHNRFEDAWGYVDIASLLYAVTELGRPENYLEIGVRRGRSSCMVVAANPATKIYGFDLWQDDYANNINPGPEFVRGELKRMGHVGEAEFFSGDSHKTIPKFLNENEGLSFDLITVDGDHSKNGAWIDLTNVVSSLRLGGVIVFDDIDNPYCPGLADVWKRFMKNYSFLTGRILTNPLGLGVAFAIRVRKNDYNTSRESKKRWASWLKWP